MKFGTVKMTPEFMVEMDAMDPKRGKTLQMSVTTDGSDASREEVEAEVRKWVQARKDGKCVVMKSFPEEPRPRRSVKEFLEDLDKPILKQVRRGCPSAGQLCACLGACNDVVSVPLDDPRPPISDYLP